ncbi:MAG: PAS domain-containing sensor histidine kinase, partial [Desulfobacterales bacterium]|nr:PAS domain-containing sensor histidine kinase [Desulfobacterales bacterium]
SITRRLDPHLPAIVGDMEKLKQAFINLVNNAFDAISDKGTITIFTRYDAELGQVIISVMDDGHGISPQELDKIFDPFFTTKPVGKGTGLGLAVTFGIIQEHNGKIEVESPPSIAINEKNENSQGTLFKMYLPVSGKKDKLKTDDIKHIAIS